FSLLGIAFALWLREIPAGHPDPRLWFNVFYVLFARNEPLGLGIVVVFSAAAFLLLRMRDTQAPRLLPCEGPPRPGWIAGAVALTVFILTAVGTHVVCHNYGLTADENLGDFQAKIFLRGKVLAEVPTQWQPAARMLAPTFVDYFPRTHSWKSTYLPVYAAMRALFQSVNLQSLLNPLLAAISVLALYGTARRVWPGQKRNAFIAIALLATSSQFLLMSMTWYAMPAHLALNLVWLWLYLSPDWRKFYLAPVVGVLAIGLHQPIVHALFVLPFLFRLLRERRWRPVVIFALMYLAGCALWYAWKAYYTVPADPSQPAAGIGQIFRLVHPEMAAIQPMNLLLVIGWACLATPLLALLGFRQFFRLPAFLRDAALSCVLTFGFYYFFYLDQGHGWGYRYFHGTLGCLVLVAVAGWNALQEKVGLRRASLFLASGIVASIVIQLPLRCWQVESFVRPYARTGVALHALPVQLVALDARDAWYSADLIRNDPFLKDRPLIVSLFMLNQSAVPVLQVAGKTRFITKEMLTELGMHTKRHADMAPDPFMLGRGK
ncbi:MAG: hypothetical protein ABI839_05115, partial [Verrucomicrobiota bacterium]